ncbi:MAG: glycosyltransferase family 4 protein [Candidatus Omnitrophica bacterium]|nr:glycosyltransferase family 4 protein [Candidatus Omnitrophota bacterium]
MFTGKIKILILDEGRVFGGAQKIILGLIPKINDKNNIEITVLASIKDDFFKKMVDLGVKVDLFPSPVFLPTSLEFNSLRVINPFNCLYDFFLLIYKAYKLKKYLIKNKIQIIQTNGMFEHIYGGLASKLCRIKALWYLQDIPHPGGFKKLKTYCLCTLGKYLPYKIVCPSKAVCDIFDSITRKKTTIIFSSIDMSKYNPALCEDKTNVRKKYGLPAKGRLVGIMGRIVYWKGHQDFLRAAKLVINDFPDVKFLIAGDIKSSKTSYLGSLKKLINDLGIEKNVVFTGFVDPIIQLLNVFDVFVQCSVHPDPCPVAVIEAAAMQKAIVATRVGGIPEIISDRKEGLLVQPYSWKQLAFAISVFLNDDRLRESCGRDARLKAISLFDVSKIADEFEDLYQTIEENNE